MGYPHYSTDCADYYPVVTEFHRERQRAHEKFGIQSREHCTYLDGSWLPVLTEELGEVARVLNEMWLGNMSKEDGIKELRKELVQVGAMAAAWIGSIDRER